MFGSIVVGTDGSDTAKEAVRQAVELARLLGAELLLVSAYDAPADSQWMVSARDDVATLLAQAEQTAHDAGVAVQTFPRQGDPADAILDVAEERDADLIVVGNKGMTGAKRFLLGTVPNRVSHHAPCSVLIIRTS
jgi:nucleotide-binding universal stress UspA family protein